MKKPTIKKAKELTGNHASWLDFKHKLMAYLNITESATKWSVPPEWIYCYKRAAGWSHKDTIKQIRIAK